MSVYSGTKHYPLNDGTLPAVVGQLDWHAEHNPNVPWVLFPSPEDPKTVRSLSFSDLALATHRVAHILRPGRAGADGEPIAMVFHCDTIQSLLHDKDASRRRSNVGTRFMISLTASQQSRFVAMAAKSSPYVRAHAPDCIRVHRAACYRID